MELTGFTKPNDYKMANTSGGFAFLAAFSMLIQAVYTAVTSYKMLTSDNGSGKISASGKPEGHWSNNKETAVKNQLYYVY